MFSTGQSNKLIDIINFWKQTWLYTINFKSVWYALALP